MNHNETPRPTPHDETPTRTGRHASTPAAHRRHAAPHPAPRPGANAGSHRAETARPGARTVLLAAAAVLTVSGTCLVLIRAGSGADQTLAADQTASAATAATSVPPVSSSASHSPRRHKPTATPTPTSSEQHDEQHPTTPAATPESHTQPTHRTTPHPARGGSGTGGGTTTPTTALGATGTAAAFAQQVVDLVNAQRAQHGCGPLTVDPHIQAAAQAHSDDMAARNYYAHDTPEGVDPGTRMTRAGFSWQSWGENIFKSPKDPATALDGWMNSPGHRANILNCSYKSTGVGVNLNPNGPWWTQDFATHS
ncbi:CAP domain-containing protein [Streptomyces sp. NPDC059101]|uniref:CAP domain-containing protein n=1 Tax=Streptomyces sp. NPDC059101 TaxID=3346728 RepID=UPI0036A9F484